MADQQENEQGRWVPAEPMPEPFGVRWGRAYGHRRAQSHGRAKALLLSWLDTRAVDRLADA